MTSPFTRPVTILSVIIILSTSVVILLSVWFIGKKYTDEISQEQLTRADYYLDSYFASLKSSHVTATTSLVSDFGFKRAIATNDPLTIQSMVNNHLKRVNLSSMMILSLSNEVISTDNHPGISHHLKSVITLFKNLNDIPLLLVVDQQLLLVSISRVNAPHHIANAIMIKRIESEQFEHLKHTTGLDFTLRTAASESIIFSTIDRLTPNSHYELSVFDSSIWRHDHYLSFEKSLDHAPPYTAELIISADLTHFYHRFERFLSHAIAISVITICIIFLLSYFVSKRLFRPLENIQNKLLNRATFDALTSLHNRITSLELANQLLNKCQNTNEPFAVAMIDIDHFKAINDTYGHATGDKVLIDVAKRLKNELRQYDVIGRLGGEEFIVAFCLSYETARTTLLRLKNSISAEVITHDKKYIHVSISIGCCYFETTKNQTTYDLESLLKQADTLLYQAKNQGRNQIVMSHQMQEYKEIKTFL